MIRAMFVLAVMAACVAPVSPANAEDAGAQRDRMVREIEALARSVSFESGRSRFETRVIDALRRVPRHEFVPAGEVANAYQNRPLPIGHGQTISQPYIVALMTDLLEIGPSERVLEIGTGSGYQAAILAELTASVYTVEIIEPLALQAAERLKRLGYATVKTRIADGYDGWKEHAPFDAIIVTAAASHVPPPLVQQLKPGGRMVIPVGASFLTQYLMLIEKKRDGALTTRQILPVRFVPLTGGR
jgi:protein-L-isoaspartate(D-aspartate) O-methyltransferase